MATPKFAIATLSLGSNLYHSLPTKIAVAASLGYDGIEIFMADFEAFVDEVLNSQHLHLFPDAFNPTSLPTPELERECADVVASLCRSHNLDIPLVQPLRYFENFRTPEELDEALDGAERWLRLMPHFGSELLLVCSNHISGKHPLSESYTITDYMNAQVTAFRLLGERAAKYNVRIGYEALAWGTVVSTWEPVWDVVKEVDLPNVGIILDSFNLLGNQYADPSTSDCVRSGQTLPRMLANIEYLTSIIPADKIFIYQIADAARPAEPIFDGPDAPMRMTWSRAMRLYPCEPPDAYDTEFNPGRAGPEPAPAREGQQHWGFLPVTEMSAIIHAAGYRGWWSLEVFNKSFLEEDEDCPRRHGRRGLMGLRTLWKETQETLITKTLSRETPLALDSITEVVRAPSDDSAPSSEASGSSTTPSTEADEPVLQSTEAEETREAKAMAPWRSWLHDILHWFIPNKKANTVIRTSVR